MPGEKDRSSGSRTLPLAELNPLLNPLLAENMGRWAEVYFTSPPERREQAVLELVRELEAEKSRQEPELDRGSVSRPVQAVETFRCDSCGRQNPISNKFCGMCGAGQGETTPHSIFGKGDSYTRDPRAADRFVEQDHSSAEEIDTSQEWPHEESSDGENRGRYPDEFERPANGNGLSLFQATSEDGEWAYEPEPSRSYRFYIGIVLAVILGVMGYMAWRGTQAAQNTHEVSAPPPAATNDAAPAPAVATSPKAAAEQPATPTGEAKTSAPADVPKSRPATEPQRNEAAQTAPPAAADSAPGAAPPQPSAGNGGEELAVAQRYLGAGGQGRDTAEAAKWLWKSVAKHNSQATLLLADLYMKGEGVSKSCDQARVLLDSAARKGVAGAGERLRNLPAFGCQ